MPVFEAFWKPFDSESTRFDHDFAGFIDILIKEFDSKVPSPDDYINIRICFIFDHMTAR